ncbi:MAG: 7-carboxy-7-deazaguanine synthase QueE [Chloroflexi bacterium]|nr:7-carboxy-7-deazaguanine synthase QueE [Chloroflexota bacterium]MCI0847422.1 7-carboxy-7-deazaguanine synthase QueE [Chloroflexota bacterium]MCI0897088.1 7-carboxy-7-deazaguanine synthase QueE [Chloroflexota bacterium]
MLKVSRRPGGEPEIFHSIQGEGVSMGVPSVFLRLATCNLSCHWCDTKYTWDWRNFDYQTEVVELEAPEIQHRIQAFNCPHVVITGGEPMLQQAGLEPLVESLAAEGYTFEVETNGTIVPLPGLLRHIGQWNVSPKLRTSGNPSDGSQIPSALKTFAGLTEAYFKFVITGESDIDEVCALRDEYHLTPDRVLLMPEGRTPDALEKKSSWLAAACVKHGFRFTTRLHILLWGDERGR